MNVRRYAFSTANVLSHPVHAFINSNVYMYNHVICIMKKLLARAKTLAQGALSNNIVGSDLVMLFRGSAASTGSITLSAPLMQPEKTERDHSHFQGLQQR